MLLNNIIVLKKFKMEDIDTTLLDLIKKLKLN